MSHHLWRTAIGRIDPMQDATEHDSDYFGGWVASGLLAAATIGMVWYFGL